MAKDHVAQLSDGYIIRLLRVEKIPVDSVAIELRRIAIHSRRTLKQYKQMIKEKENESVSADV